jgi:hypothetical protein
MHRVHIPRPAHATVVAYLALFVAMSGTAVAATGGTFILGSSNRAGQASILANPNGHPLTLKAEAGHPPLKVNRTKLVPRLNADRVDGLHASQFLRALCTLPEGQKGCVRIYEVSTPIIQFVIPGVSFVGAAALCDRHDIVLGGGYHLAGPANSLDMVRSSFAVGRGWQVNLEPHPANGGVLNVGSEARAVCMSDDGFSDL